MTWTRFVEEDFDTYPPDLAHVEFWRFTDSFCWSIYGEVHRFWTPGESLPKVSVQGDGEVVSSWTKAPFSPETDDNGQLDPPEQMWWRPKPYPGASDDN